MIRLLFLVIGGISLFLGVLGIFLPVLPTTPFLLLSAFLFARSSERLHTYLVNHPVLGEYISNYYNNTMTRAHKLRTVGMLWLSITLTCGFLVWSGRTIPAVILPVIASLVTVHILTLRPKGTPRPEEEELTR
jgi:uncharacterized protein